MSTRSMAVRVSQTEMKHQRRLRQVAARRMNLTHHLLLAQMKRHHRADGVAIALGAM